MVPRITGTVGCKKFEYGAGTIITGVSVID